MPADRLADLRATYSSLRDNLARLVEYYRAVPDQAGRFGADPDTLKCIAAVAAERVELVTSLISALDVVTRA